MTAHLAAPGIAYMLVALVAILVLVGQHVARRLALRKYRVRVVTIGPSLSAAYSKQQPRPVAREELDIPPARRVPMGDPLRKRRRSPRSTARY